MFCFPEHRRKQHDTLSLLRHSSLLSDYFYAQIALPSLIFQGQPTSLSPSFSGSETNSYKQINPPPCVQSTWPSLCPGLGYDLRPWMTASNCPLL